ncbi:MAG: PHP domain-containing protein, partial [Ilumatobacteraceae bacterium]
MAYGSGGIGGHVPQLLLENKQEELDNRISWYLDTFGPERFYLEIQPEDQPKQKA